MAITLAIRLGRSAAEEARLDIQALQYERETKRALSKDLREKRKQWQETEVKRVAEEDARRVQEAAAKAQREMRAEQERQRKYQEEAKKETERIRIEREAQKIKYEAQQAVFETEMRKREEQERKIIEAQRAAVRLEEERLRKEREEERQRLEEERRQREEEEENARTELIRRKIEERKRLEKIKKKFAMRLEGAVTSLRPPKGTMIPGALDKEAQVQVAVTCGSLLSGSMEPLVVNYASQSDATESIGQVVARQCSVAAEAHASAIRLQGMASASGATTSPLSWMDEVELRYWRDVAATRTAVKAFKAMQRALQSYDVQQPFDVRTEYGVLPVDHPQQTCLLLRRAAGFIEQGDVSGAEVVLSDMIEIAEASFYDDDKGQNVVPVNDANKVVLPAVLVLSHFIGRMLADRPSLVVDAPGWFEAAAALMRRMLQEGAAGSPPDSLLSISQIVSTTLTPEHPVAMELASLAEKNLSSSTKRQREEKIRMREAELAAKLLEEEWPDEAEMRKARAEDREAKTPIPERAWALRNVAGTLALGGPGERGRARQLLERAVLLKQGFAGAADHPAVLPELIALVDLLSSEKEWANDAAGAASLVVRIFRNISDAYNDQAGDAISAVILLEAALRKYEEVAGLKSSAVKGAARQAETLLEYSLPPDDQSKVAQYRRQSDTVLTTIVDAFTEQLGAYTGNASKSKAQDWDVKGVTMIGPLH